MKFCLTQCPSCAWFCADLCSVFFLPWTRSDNSWPFCPSCLQKRLLRVLSRLTLRYSSCHLLCWSAMYIVTQRLQNFCFIGGAVESEHIHAQDHIEKKSTCICCLLDCQHKRQISFLKCSSLNLILNLNLHSLVSFELSYLQRCIDHNLVTVGAVRNWHISMTAIVLYLLVSVALYSAGLVLSRRKSHREAFENASTQQPVLWRLREAERKREREKKRERERKRERGRGNQCDSNQIPSYFLKSSISST